MNNNNIFSIKNKVELSKYTGINYYIFKLEDKQSLFGLIYSLGLIKLKTLKTYIEINVANSFIWLFKLFIKILILFDQKFYGSFQLYINYQSFNNLTIKNRYLLLLINESPN